jgi:hypothetical protein
MSLTLLYSEAKQKPKSNETDMIPLPGPCIIKIITAVIYGFHNKQECFPLNIRLVWKGLQGTNILACYGNSKKFYDRGPWGQDQMLKKFFFLNLQMITVSWSVYLW